MKIILFVLAVVLLTACSSRDIVTMDQPTKQAYDLNDKDADGVIVAREQCTGTLTGADINNYGCGTITEVIDRSELKVLFENDSYYLDPMYFGQLETMAAFMHKYPITTVTIEGHCSKTGDYEHNLTLSQNRADSVIAILHEKFGIEKDRLTAVGYSFSQLVNDEVNEVAHTQNRRVIAEMVGDDTIPDMRWNIYTVDEIDEN